MGLKKQILEDKRLARISGDKERVIVLGVLIGEIELSDKVKIIDGEKVVSNDVIISIIKKMVKDNITTNNEEENRVIEGYLPKVLSEEETETAVESIISKLEVSTMKDMGKVMGEMKRQYGATIDGKLTSDIVKKLLK